MWDSPFFVKPQFPMKRTFRLDMDMDVAAALVDLTSLGALDVLLLEGALGTKEAEFLKLLLLTAHGKNTKDNPDAARKLSASLKALVRELRTAEKNGDT